MDWIDGLKSWCSTIEFGPGVPPVLRVPALVGGKTTATKRKRLLELKSENRGSRIMKGLSDDEETLERIAEMKGDQKRAEHSTGQMKTIGRSQAKRGQRVES